MGVQTRSLKHGGYGFALLCSFLGAVFVSVLIPSDDIRWMREHWQWFNRPMLWIEQVDTGVNLVHAILFMLLGVTARVALPRWWTAMAALGFLVLGIGTEVLQFLVPGRHPRMSDVVVDVVAGLLGWAALHGFSAWRTRLRAY